MPGALDGIRIIEFANYVSGPYAGMLLADLGATPLSLARAGRAGVARLLLETTDLPVTEAAFAAGFASLRQFNATIREVYDATPTELRERGRRRDHRRRGPARGRRRRPHLPHRAVPRGGPRHRPCAGAPSPIRRSALTRARGVPC